MTDPARVCDVCDGAAVWLYRTSGSAGVISGRIRLSTNQHPTCAEVVLDHTWPMCPLCARHVERREVPGLVRRYLEHNVTAPLWPAVVEARRTIGDLFMQLLEALEPQREFLLSLPDWAAAPADLPKYRDRLIGWLGRYRETFAADPRPGTNVHPLHVPHLRWAELFYVDPEYTAFVTTAAADAPPTQRFRFGPDDLPANFGLVVYGQPIVWYDTDQFRMRIVAASWGRVDGGVLVHLYVPTDDARRHGAESVAAGDPAQTGRLHQVGYGLTIGYDAGQYVVTDGEQPVELHPHPPASSLIAVQSAELALATVITTWLLINQRVTGETRVEPKKAIARAYRKAGRPPPGVRVITLRQARHTTVRHDDDTPAGDRPKRTFAVRWPVRGHWRNQAYGPRRAQRRRIYIHPFVKGPNDAPLRITQQVHALRRERTSRPPANTEPPDTISPL